MELTNKQQEFLALCERTREHALGMKNPLIVHHYDADGLAGGAIACSAFISAKNEFRRLCIKKLDDRMIEKLKGGGEGEIIFIDLGSGNALVNEFSDAVIIDHHQPSESIKTEFHVNGMPYGIDGGEELSGATTAYLVFRERVDLAITGAVADQQAPLKGMNRYVLEEGISRGEVKTENDLCFYGRYARPLLQFLSLSDDPYVPGISYNEDKAAQLLNDLGIGLQKEGGWKTYSDLKDEEKKKLVNALVDILINRGLHKKAEEIICESYVFPRHEKDETYEAGEFATLLNACGRHNADEVAIGVCLNDKEAMEKAMQLLSLHKQKLREGIEFASKNIRDLGKFYFLDGRGTISEGILGVICGMIIPYNAGKPLIGVSMGEENTLKFSGRTNRMLIAKGINLGEAMVYACGKAGGVGGGHRIAAGASIPSGRINEFLVALGEKIRPLS